MTNGGSKQDLSFEAGMTLLELMIVVSIVGIMLAIMAPLLSGTTVNARERNLMEQFTVDYDWARSRGVAGATASLTLNANCTWTTSTGSTSDATHSLTVAQLTSQAPGLTCASGTLALPATFTFNNLGFISNASTGTFTFKGSKGSTWSLQIMYSGSVVRLNGAS